MRFFCFEFDKYIRNKIKNSVYRFLSSFLGRLSFVKFNIIISFCRNNVYVQVLKLVGCSIFKTEAHVRTRIFYHRMYKQCDKKNESQSVKVLKCCYRKEIRKRTIKKISLIFKFISNKGK
jgi:hypothetical protein